VIEDFDFMYIIK